MDNKIYNNFPINPKDGKTEESFNNDITQTNKWCIKHTNVHYKSN